MDKNATEIISIVDADDNGTLVAALVFDDVTPTQEDLDALPLTDLLWVGEEDEDGTIYNEDSESDNLAAILTNHGFPCHALEVATILYI